MRRSASKPLTFVVAVMTLLALVIPFSGTALANHQGGDPTRIDLGPDDTAPVGSCNEFTLRAFMDNRFAEGETIDITVTQADADRNRDLQISFCDPDGAGPGSNLAGAQTPQGTQSGPNPATDCDDDATAALVINDGGCPAGAPQSNFEHPATIHDECFTNERGECVFGVTSTEVGTMNLTAFFDANNNNVRDGTEPFDQATKTWTPGGGEAVRNIVCQPAADSNPEGTRHEFRCTVTDAAGNPVPGVTVTFDVTGGPNAEEIGPTNCTVVTNAQGQTAAPAAEQAGGGQPTTSTSGACGYNDVVGANSPPGTDTITAFVNQAAPPGGTSSPGLDPHEPRTTITKTWVGPARTIDCEPEAATNAPGTTHTVTCTVRDAAGNPVPGVAVTFTEAGPGRFTNDQGNDNVETRTTNAAGQAEIQVTSSQNETGTQTITGDINPTNATNAECRRLAGDPAGAPAGVCEDQVTKTWGQQPPPPPPEPECNDKVDNDNDGFVDFPNDPNCVSPQDDSEAGPTDVPEQCNPQTAGNISGRVIIGTDEADVITGTENDDIICALGGNDTVSGLGGDDLILLGGGDDTADGGDGADTIRGGGGNDTIRGGGGKDILRGGGGNDAIAGQAGNDLIVGGRGEDSLKGNRGIDTLRGGRHGDTLQGGKHEDNLKGGGGDDILRGWTGDDTLAGGKGDDNLKGHGGDDILRGGRGTDVCNGGPGEDKIFGCEG